MKLICLLFIQFLLLHQPVVEAQVKTPDAIKGVPEPFNVGRTRCYYGGMSFSPDGKTLYHTHVYLADSVSAITGKIGITTWQNNQWTTSSFPNFTPGYSESYPVWAQAQNRLYFSSYAPPKTDTSRTDQNIWFVEKKGSGWSSPVPVEGLNSEHNDRLAFIDGDGYFYIVSDRAGNYDIYRTQLLNGKWTEAEPMLAWNSAQQEEYASVYPNQKVAFIQRSTPGESTEILISRLSNGTWSNPEPFAYDFKNTQLPYVQRWPMLSPDLSTFYMVGQGIIWQQSASALLRKNKVHDFPAITFKPLPSKKRDYGEPEVFGGMLLKSNNGIAFTPDMKTVYLSRYTRERDSVGNQCIKVFQSILKDGVWSTPIETAFNNPSVPFEYHPVLSPDGKRLFYNSRAPLPNAREKYHAKNNLWYVDKQSDGSWSTPKPIEALATDDYDDYCSVTLDGTLYFRSDRPGGKGSGDIYRAQFLQGKYQQPENVAELNSELNENDLCIDPKGRFIIFNRFEQKGDQPNIILFISIKTDTGWTKPRVIQQLEKPYDYELTPTLSPDGHYFYYEVNANILRVELQSLFLPDELKLLQRKQ